MKDIADNPNEETECFIEEIALDYCEDTVIYVLTGQILHAKDRIDFLELYLGDHIFSTTITDHENGNFKAKLEKDRSFNLFSNNSGLYFGCKTQNDKILTGRINYQYFQVRINTDKYASFETVNNYFQYNTTTSDNVLIICPQVTTIKRKNFFLALSDIIKTCGYSWKLLEKEILWTKEEYLALFDKINYKALLVCNESTMGADSSNTIAQENLTNLPAVKYLPITDPMHADFYQEINEFIKGLRDSK